MARPTAVVVWLAAETARLTAAAASAAAAVAVEGRPTAQWAARLVVAMARLTEVAMERLTAAATAAMTVAMMAAAAMATLTAEGATVEAWMAEAMAVEAAEAKEETAAAAWEVAMAARCSEEALHPLDTRRWILGRHRACTSPGSPAKGSEIRIFLWSGNPSKTKMCPQRTRFARCSHSNRNGWHFHKGERVRAHMDPLQTKVAAEVAVTAVAATTVATRAEAVVAMVKAAEASVLPPAAHACAGS